MINLRGVLSRDPQALSAFLRRHAIAVDNHRIPLAMQRVQRIAKKRRRKGMEMKFLLQELDRPIDWRLAEVLEELAKAEF